MAPQKKTQARARSKSFSLPLELKGIAIITLSSLLLLSLVSFNQQLVSHNWLGLIGHWLALSMNYLFGLTSFFVAGLLLWEGIQAMRGKTHRHPYVHLFYCALFIISSCFLLNVFAEEFSSLAQYLKRFSITQSAQLMNYTKLRYNLGGIPAYYIYRDLPYLNLQILLSPIGTTLVFCSLFTLATMQLTQWRIPKALWRGICWSLRAFFTKCKAQINRPKPPKPQPVSPLKTNLKRALPEVPTFSHIEEEDVKPLPKPQPPPSSNKRQEALSAQKRVNGDMSTYQLPPISLLTDAKRSDQAMMKKDLAQMAKVLEETLLSFGIEAKVGNISCGPTITSFEVHPAVGVKVQRIKALESDIALNLQAKSIRIIAPIPGKAAVGVEVPNLKPQEVGFKEMLSNYQSSGKQLTIPVLIGKGVSGEDVTNDLAKMPHCIIAGATGSGKSVCINTIVMSILMTARPDEIKLLMVDPKKVELTSYTRLPHLIAPVITEPNGAAAALNWLVKEMERRYELLKQVGMRNIISFNQRSNEDRKKEAELEIEVPANLPYIVAIIDELADLMMVSAQDIETPIARIAQMARAVGIHLILATQRPSREVITGLIKANFPTRIAFKVSSRVNSQIILDETGADCLLGNGDMLFLPPGTSTLIRAQGAYIRDDDINRVIAFIANQAPPSYLIPSFDKMSLEEFGASAKDADNADPLFLQALEIVQSTGNASTTFLQRKLKIGYARAASLMDELEAQGIVSAQEGSRARQVYGANKKDE